MQSTRHGINNSLHGREKGDASKARDFLPADKQYLVTRGVPCLRRATSLAYTDADEDAERLVSFADTQGGEAEEWVETHAGRKLNVDSAVVGNIDDIPDLDPQEPDNIASGMGSLSLGPSAGGGATETPNLDDIPDMEEDDLEEKDEATATTTPSGVNDTGCVLRLITR
jgi:ubiquitin-like-conjugating enzyme ATG3